ncbi:LPS export ABC transporter periplasmic protein LptC [Paracoccus laeviglucosivorans]|uniref:Lipopolysaccharide export system protein LptC n=1 Tax=Paracoccus laeviglucosivorans TaxID=1197861 RepID=A0A521EH25_9RHOB|nr:LPS export ABC transporter periplasmic protein LptC [Paracoccus laeviglucosivorans]SMO83213.1 lipopolysaccharide export system protein LptC [Paracoccus laeviglucosivorans]
MLRSRIVAWLRVILPLTALALLSVLFLLGRKPEPDATIPYANVDPQELAERQAVTNPTYTGVTSNGSELTISGAEAVPGKNSGEGSVSTVRLTLRAQDGRAADVSAGSAELKDDQVTLGDGVRMTTADGWVVTAPQFDASIAEGTLRADREVNVRAPFGDLTAGQMELRPTEPGNPDHILDLKGGVRLIYRP